ncbi:MAG TPA: hypothetical protein VN605_01195 [Thermoanaerobaculia bacterium]|nr:hypothetical protein [Thermoanaerobaculia bacterium]
MRKLIGLIAFVAALPLQADMRAQLDAPRAGAVLRGGTTATIAWSARELPRFAEEWEAFLSADGGRHYAYRITPHLDLDQRHFTFEVPNVETGDARILIRAGDERREIELELPATFAIRQDRFKATAAGPSTLDEEQRGEPARAGEAGVIEWVDGDRDGGHLTPRSALHHDGTIRGAARIDAGSDSGEAAGAISLILERAAESRQQLSIAASSPCARAKMPRAGRDVLLAGRRLNL